MSVSLVKMSVIGFGVYGWKAIVDVVVVRETDVDSELRSILNGEMFAPRDRTVKIAVGAQIGFLQRVPRSRLPRKCEGDSLGELFR
jgi:hypothetical protein